MRPTSTIARTESMSSIDHPIRPGPPKRLGILVQCWEEDRDAGNHPGVNKPTIGRDEIIYGRTGPVDICLGLHRTVSRLHAAAGLLANTFR
jgi:hypothetical protein